MTTDFQILPIPTEAYSHLLTLNEEELSRHQAIRQTVTAKPGFPCRNTLRDANIGEEVILFPYSHHAVDGPYRSSGPVYILPFAPAAAAPAELAKSPKRNEIPLMLTLRDQSLRAYDASGMMINAKVVTGPEMEAALNHLFSQPAVVEVHLHNASPGCFNCRAIRA